MLPASIFVLCMTALAPVATALPLPSMARQIPFGIKFSRPPAPKGGFFNPPRPRPSSHHMAVLRILEDDDDLNMLARPAFAVELDVISSPPSMTTTTVPVVADSPTAVTKTKKRKDGFDDGSIFSDMLMGPGGYAALETARVAIASPMYSGLANMIATSTIEEAGPTSSPFAWVESEGVTRPEVPEAVQTPTFHFMNPGPVVTATAA
ncbi:BQ2448_7983 [Microbotryum intermedium]|uniref:BQ2448_7983 protein n=1 Tax=Microbotryum intermedium TaxID=269621 RepID=A0A238FSX1_9BASI|nr:BQ2448_7983 [Microbotryum intermedium]